MIELFKQPNLDWMGKAKYFFALSGTLLAIGWAAIFFKGGIKYGIDFRGGTNVDVRFAQPPLPARWPKRFPTRIRSDFLLPPAINTSNWPGPF